MKKKVLILGASSDIGIEILRMYQNDSYDVVAHYNTGNKKFFNFVKTYNIRKIKFNFLKKFKMIDSFSKKKIFKNCEILINAIGGIKQKKYSEISSKELLDSFKINLIPSIIFNKNIGFQMNKKKWGRIVNLGSIGTKFGGGKNNFPYSLAKFGLEFFSSNTKEWIKNNVLINTIRVGVTKTKLHNRLPSKNMKKRIKQIPIGRMAHPKEIANLVYYLGSEQNSYIANEIITISGGE